MELTDVRRLTGVNFMMDRPGAAAEAVVPDSIKDGALSFWRKHMRVVMDGVGWENERIAIRSYEGGATLMVSAPIDSLYTAADMIEHVWDEVHNELSGDPISGIAQTTKKFIAKIADESNSEEVALALEAANHGVTFLGNDKNISVGLGTGCQVWPENELPKPEDIDWDQIHDIPLALVTGTNGKSTTVRLTAAIGAAAKRTVGFSSSDWVKVGTEIIDEGDYSGPAGARLAVRDSRVELALIETARGGLMRRGLPIPQAEACLITNIAADHLGDYGINDVASLADAKFLLAKAVKPGGRLILNNDDSELVSRSVSFEGDITWYGLAFDEKSLSSWIDAGGHAAFIKDENMVLARDKKITTIMPVVDFVPGMKGAAKFNISNALGAIALASALDLPIEAMKKGLDGFKGTPEENPGRGNFMEIGGLTILVDFAHNAHGLAALAEAVKDIPAKRRLILLSHAGDRSDEDIREMTRAAWLARPDKVIVKELESKLRGRQLGEIPTIIADELSILGANDDTVSIAINEIESVYQALDWAKPDDFLMLILHDKRKPTMDLLEQLKNKNWQAGEALPV